MNKKIVLLPIKVPKGLFCWSNRDAVICEHFDNEGGHPYCKLKIGNIKQDKTGAVWKPKECLELKEIQSN